MALPDTIAGIMSGDIRTVLINSRPLNWYRPIASAAGTPRQSARTEALTATSRLGMKPFLKSTRFQAWTNQAAVYPSGGKDRILLLKNATHIVVARGSSTNRMTSQTKI